MTFAACPDSELLAACAEGRLRADERERVLRHLTTCHDCYTVFTEALHLLDELPALVAERAESRVPVVGGAERALSSREQPVTPSQTEPAMSQPVDGPTPAAVPATPTPSSLVQPDAPDTAKPDNRGGQSRDNVVPFDRRRSRRVATVALPLAAAAALTVVVMQQHPPRAPISSPVTMAQAPSPEPTAVATPTPWAPAWASVKSAAMRDLLPLWSDSSAFDGGVKRGLATRCRYAALISVDIEVALAHDPSEALLRVRNAAAFIRASGDDELGRHFEWLASEARSERLPTPGNLRPTACSTAPFDAARTVEWVRLAAVTRDTALLRHPEVVAGLSAGHVGVPATDRSAFDELAQLAQAPPASGDSAAWMRLRRRAEDLASGWLP